MLIELDNARVCGIKWLEILINELDEKFSDKINIFPCVFSRKVYAYGHVQILPISLSPTGSYNFEQLKEGLTDYIRIYANWDGNIKTAYPLLVLFQPSSQYMSSENYNELALQAMQYLLNNDPSNWPETIPLLPNNKNWSFCFSGEQIFINVSHPKHIFRHSRNLCNTLALVINPRKNFDIVASVHTKSGMAIRNKIRSNINKYDDIPYSPFLGHYQLGDSEWSQYILPQTNNEPPSKCPLKFNVVEGILSE